MGCPACTSPNRGDIEAKLKAKESYRSIAKWLQAERGETIAHTTIFKHGQEHMGQAAAFADKLLSLPKLVLALNPVREEGPPSDNSLPPLEALAKVQNKAFDIMNAMDLGSGITPQEVTLFLGCMKSAAMVAKHRHELVFGRKYVVETKPTHHPALKENSTDELKARLAALKKKREDVE